MSYKALLEKLIERISETNIRVDFIATFGLIVEAYRTGKINEDKVRGYIHELVMDALTMQYPDLDIDELRKRALEWVDKFVSALRVERMKYELMSIHRGEGGLM
jgi:hypothetical protein